MSKLSKACKLIIFLIFIITAGCNKSNLEQKEVLISVSIPPLADFARNIVGNRALVHTVIPPGTNLHSFEPHPESIKVISNSDIYVRIGEDLKFEEILLNKIGVEKLKSTLNLSEHVKFINHDPHIWLSPEIAKNIVELMFTEFTKLLPQHKLYFNNNKNRYIAKLDSIDQNLSKILEMKKQKILFVYHPAWKYFSDYYSLEQIEIEKDGKSPKAKDLSELTTLAKEKQISCIFYDPHFDNSAVLALARNLNIDTDSLDPLPNDYLENLIIISKKIEKHFK